jgi:hypothetical protein
MGCSQIIKESFLEDINNILNAGEVLIYLCVVIFRFSHCFKWFARYLRIQFFQVPDLFAADETSKIIEAVRPKAKAAGKVYV